MPPYRYSILCDKCGSVNIEWSEFEHKIWCYECKIDTDGNGGIFDSPIPVGACELMGISFARLYLKDNIIRYPVTRKNKVIYTKVKPEGTTEYKIMPLDPGAEKLGIDTDRKKL